MKITYIPDEEINLNQEKDKNPDLLGTMAYCETLKQIINNAETPLTIGLFGGWGSGKSSILKTLKNQMGENTKIAFFTYDAWKYSNDSFRRTFILKLKEQFKLEEGEDYQNFYNDKHEEIKTKLGITDKWWVYIIIAIVSLIIMNSINIVNVFTTQKFDKMMFIISTFISILIFFVTKTFIQYKISITKPRTFAPEQFEDALDDAIQKITKKQNLLLKPLNWFGFGDRTVHAEKIVIVIDNIDRCHKDIVFELLITIKNFLEKKNVIFILPIDDESLKKHLENEGHDSNEFLRKLFNTTLTIKNFSEDDLYEFTKKLVEKYKIDHLSSDDISLISQEFSNNPRKIIQFLNVLQTELLLAKKLENTLNINKGTITDNKAFFIILLLIKEEWSDIYKILKDKPYLLKNLKTIKTELEKYLSKLNSPKYENKIDTKLTEKQINFFTRNSPIINKVKNIEVFFANKEIDVPRDLKELILTNNWEAIKKYLKENKITFERLIRFIDDFFRTEFLKREIKLTGVHIFLLIFKIINDKDYSKEFKNIYSGSSKFVGDIKQSINDSENKELIRMLNNNNKPNEEQTLMHNFDDLIEFAKFDLKENKNLLKNIIEIISNNSNSEIGLFISYVQKFQNNTSQLELIKPNFTAFLKQDLAIYTYLIDKPIPKKILVKLIEPIAVTNLITDLERKYDQAIEIIKNYHEIKKLEEETLTTIINYYCKLLMPQENKPKYFIMMEDLKFFIKDIQNITLLDTIYENLQNQYNYYARNYNNINNKNNIITFLELSTELYKKDPNKYSIIITSWLDWFFVNTPYCVQVNEMYENIIKYFQVFNWEFANIVITKLGSQKIAETVDVMVQKTTNEKGLNEQQIEKIITYYINENTEWFNLSLINDKVKKVFKNWLSKQNITEQLIILEKIKNIEIKFLIEVVEEIASTIIEYITTNTTAINSFFKFIIDNKLINKSISKIWADKIKPLLVSTNKEEQIVALKIVKELELDNAGNQALYTLIKDINTDSYSETEKILVKEILKKITKKKGKKK